MLMLIFRSLLSPLNPTQLFIRSKVLHLEPNFVRNDDCLQLPHSLEKRCLSLSKCTSLSELAKILTERVRMNADGVGFRYAREKVWEWENQRSTVLSERTLNFPGKAEIKREWESERTFGEGSFGESIHYLSQRDKSLWFWKQQSFSSKWTLISECPY